MAWPEGEATLHQVARAELLRSDGIDAGEPTVKADMSTTIWVGGIPLVYATEAHLVQTFLRFGEIRSVTVRAKDGLNKSWALITFEKSDSVETALTTPVDVTGDGSTNPSTFLQIKPAMNNADQRDNRIDHGGAFNFMMEKHGSTLPLVGNEHYLGHPRRKLANSEHKQLSEIQPNEESLQSTDSTAHNGSSEASALDEVLEHLSALETRFDRLEALLKRPQAGSRNTAPTRGANT